MTSAQLRARVIAEWRGLSEAPLEVERGFRELGDDLRNTVDYFAVCQAVKALAGARPRRLIETLAEEIAAAVLRDFAVAAVEVELRKFILPDTAFVAVKLRREP